MSNDDDNDDENDDVTVDRRMKKRSQVMILQSVDRKRNEEGVLDN